MRTLTILLYFFSITACLSQPCQPTKLDLSNIVLTEEDKSGTAFKLFDEQTTSGDPLDKKGGAPKTVWFPGWKKENYPASVTLNLRNPAKISTISLRDVQNKGVFKIEAGTPGNWRSIVVDSLNHYQTWNNHDVDVTTQYLRFIRLSTTSNAAEVVLYGCMLADEGSPAPITDLRTTVISDQSIKILWSATGDDAKIGSAKAYEIRYSTMPIKNMKDFNKATISTQKIVPAYSGTMQSKLVRGLATETEYYFAIQAIDEEGNYSGLSNIISATTLALQSKNIITMDKFIGANALIDDPIEKMKAVGFIREYHSWRWDEGGAKKYIPYPNNKLEFAPSAAGEGSWNFDRFYTNVNEAGLEISPVIQGSVKWLQGSNEFPFDYKPLDAEHANPTNPNSYRAKANHAYQFAARYGNTKVKEKNLMLANGQPRLSGLNLIHYLEDWNEPNKTWLASNAEFQPQEYAAMASANYDGHANTMNNDTHFFGIKNADPNMKFVMGGIARLDLEWIEKIESWFENNRPDHQFIPDVINVHHYSWKSEKGWQGGGPAKSPEEDNFKDRLKAFVEYRDNHLPSVEVWISEFGWDTNPGSPLCAPRIGTFDAQEVQGQWLVRAYLAFAAAGVDRAQMYMLRDVNPNSGRWFNSCGLTGPKGDWTPKKSWYYVYTLKNTLKDMIFIGEEESSDPNILIYKFKNINNDSGAYAVWSKTSVQNEIPDFTLPLSDACTTAQQIMMEVGSSNGITTTLPIQNKSVTVLVSERPLFVLVDNIL